MKLINLKVTVVSLLAFFSLTSCEYQEDSVVYYLEDSMSESINIVTDGEQMSIQSNNQAKFKISESEVYKDYAKRLEDIQIVDISINANNHSQIAIHGKLMMDGMEIYKFDDMTSKNVYITDQKVINYLEQKFLEDKELSLEFSTQCTHSKDFNIKVDLKLNGTFVN